MKKSIAVKTAFQGKSDPIQNRSINRYATFLLSVGSLTIASSYEYVGLVSSNSKSFLYPFVMLDGVVSLFNIMILIY
jgi:hypothetical protein